LFPLIFWGEFYIAILIAELFNLETQNSLFADIYGIVVFSTLIVFFVKIIKDHKAELSDKKFPIIGIKMIGIIYFVFGIVIFNTVVHAIVMLFRYTI
jgi:hypothetical protein